MGFNSGFKGLILHSLLAAVHSSVVNEFMVTVNFKYPSVLAIFWNSKPQRCGTAEWHWIDPGSCRC